MIGPAGRYFKIIRHLRPVMAGEDFASGSNHVPDWGPTGGLSGESFSVFFSFFSFFFCFFFFQFFFASNSLRKSDRHIPPKLGPKLWHISHAWTPGPEPAFRVQVTPDFGGANLAVDFRLARVAAACAGPVKAGEIIAGALHVVFARPSPSC